MDTQQLVSPGRDALLATLSATLAQARLLTLTGPGGVGKTWLARNAVRGREARWVDLAGLAEGGFVVPTIAAACGIVEQGQKPWLDLLRDGLRERTMVLLLDSCEHVREAVVELCAALLPACPNLTILATSRVPLHLSDEQRMVVPPLDPAAAVALFVERAAVRVPGFRLDAVTTPLVEQICARLEGMPLALELAAARLPLLSTAQLAERLDQSLLLLAARNPELPVRQRSLRATLDWSYGLLADDAQALVRRLALFVGSFELAAVESVCDLPTALDGLETLLDAGLVVIASREEAASTRYRLHDVVRQYAAELLAHAGEAETYRQRLVAWAVALAEQAGAELEGEQQVPWKGHLAAEHANLRAALVIAEHASDAAAMLRITTPLFQFWNSGAVSEGRDWLRRALLLATGQVSTLTVKGWNLVSTLAYRQGDYATLGEAAETAMGQAQALQDAEGMAAAHHRLGIYHAMHGRLPEAHDHYQQSRMRYQELHHQRGLYGALSALAHLAVLRGQPLEARSYYEQALTYTRAANDKLNTGAMLFNLGNLLFNEDWRAAEPLYAESLALMREVGGTSYLPHLAHGLGQIAYRRGELEAAAAHFDEGLQIAQRLKLGELTALLTLKRANVAVDMGDVARAVPLLNEALQLTMQHARPQPRAEVLCHCARLVGRLGYPTPALTLFAAGLHALEAQDFRQVAMRLFNAFDAEQLTQAYEAVQATLTPDEGAAAYAAGQTLTLDQASHMAFSAIHLPPRAAGSSQVHALELFTFGTLRVLRQGHELTAEAWVYSKTRELLLVLLHVESASKEQIGAVLWPDASPQQLKQNFRMAMYHLRRALGRPEWITLKGGRYAFNRTLDYWHDGAAFRAALAAPAPDPAARRAQLQQAVALYQGDLVLEGLDSEVLLICREQLRQQALDALLELASLHMTAGDCPAASSSYRRAIALDPYLETAHRGLMQALAQQGERSAALAHYKALEQLLRRDLAAEVDPATRTLAEQIARGASPDHR